MKKNNLRLKVVAVLLVWVTLVTQTFAMVVEKKPKEIVVLVHGLLRTYRSMTPLKVYLERQGYHVYYFSYPSSQYSIPKHAAGLKLFIEQLLANNPNAKVNFVTHSMGGILVRVAVSELPKQEFDHIGRLVMLAPPNQGSVLAKLSTKIFPFVTSSIKPLAELSSDQQAYVHHVPLPSIEMGIIAGRFDAKVPPSAARLEGLPDPVIVNTTHTFIMNNKKTMKLVRAFLKSGVFDNDRTKTEPRPRESG